MRAVEASYYRARYYDPTSGRFLSEDPLGFLAGVNKYKFFRNSPLNWVDRFGTSEGGCGCPQGNNGPGGNSNRMPPRRRLGLAASGLANVLAGGFSIALALGGEAGSAGLATPIAGYLAVQGAGHFVQGVTEVLVAVTGDNVGEALVTSATNATNDLSILGVASSLMHNQEISAFAKGSEGAATTDLFEPENLPLIGLEAAHAIMELLPNGCPAN